MRADYKKRIPYFRKYRKEHYRKNRKYVLKRNKILLKLGNTVKDFVVLNTDSLAKLGLISSLSQRLKKEEDKNCAKDKK